MKCKFISCNARPWVVFLWLVSVAATRVQANFSWSTNTDGTIIIEDYAGPGGNVDIPGTIEGKLVGAIGNCVFSPSDNLTEVTMPDSITNIGMSAFMECAGLTNVVISGNVVQIEDGAFYGCAGLTRVTIPDSVVRLGGLVFNSCAGLTNIAIPKRVSDIGAGAFGACARLNAIEVAASNAAYGSVDGVLFNKDGTTLIQCPAGKTGSVLVAHTATAIGELAFAGCAGLTRIEIPDGVRRIELRAFVGCAGLTNAAIPGSVTQIVGRAHVGCGRLLDIEVQETNAAYRSIAGVLFDKSGRTLLEYPGGRTGTCEIAAGATDIGEAAFAYNSNLTRVVIAASVTNIGDSAFDGCVSLTNAVLGDGVRHIGDCAFSFCLQLSDVNFGCGLRSIGQGAFAACASLKGPVIPEGVTELGYWAFSGCAALTNLTIPDSVIHIGAYAFQYGGFAQVAIGSGLDHMESALFEGCTNLARITIPATVATMDGYVFEGCSGLTAVYFLGGPPAAEDTDVFSDSTPTVYYLPGTPQWEATFGGRPTAPWLPEVRAEGLGAHDDHFGLTLAWAAGKTVVVEACTNLENPAWMPVATNTLTAGMEYFMDSGWTNRNACYYRLREL